ncbi:hypothetical protein F5Y16DRAFT_394590 [Xylariaceae sp. FL0255]|nr:hypothetical protein F5Y16DRAFT_394590 [Xylariaceae sp. FL0255]
MVSVDALNGSMADLRARLDTETLTTFQLVSDFLAKIDMHNTNGLGVRGLISVAPRESLIMQADSLDAERKSKGSKGLFRGIPFIVKTGLYLTKVFMGIPATFGCAAFSDAVAAENAAFGKVDRLAQLDESQLSSLEEINGAKDIPPCTVGGLQLLARMVVAASRKVVQC